jgi:prepilin-type processing-associated H-X9-DG protein
LSSFGKPSESILGSLKGPGGRAVIFVDGHVTWEGE